MVKVYEFKKPSELTDFISEIMQASINKYNQAIADLENQSQDYLRQKYVEPEIKNLSGIFSRFLEGKLSKDESLKELISGKKRCERTLHFSERAHNIHTNKGQ